MSEELKTYKMYNMEDRIEYNNYFNSYNLSKITYKGTDKLGNKILLAETYNNESFCLRYEPILMDEIIDTLLSDGMIYLVGKYIQNFDYNDFSEYSNYLSLGVIANHSYWDGVTNFEGMSFGSNQTSFDNAIFSEEGVNFSNTDFSQCNASFRNVHFMGGYINFNYACFGDGKYDFIGMNLHESSLGFFNANLGKGKVFFNASNFGDCPTRFQFTDFNKASVSFVSIKSSSLNFTKNVFNSDIIISFKSIKTLVFDACINKSVIQINGVIEKLSFINCTNLGMIDINWAKSNVKQAIINAYSLNSTDNIYNIDGNEYFFSDFEMTKKVKYESAAHDFLLLKENYRNMGQYEWEDAAYRAYMKYNTKAMEWPKKCFIKKPFTWLFGLISGYGTKVGNILASCLISILISGAIYCNAFYDKAPTFRSILKSMYFSTITFLTIGYGDLSPITAEFSDFQTIWTGFEGFTGLLLMSMVTVVVMRKILR